MENIFLECSCGIVQSVNRLYFCGSCVTFRCPVCSEQEVVSSYCNRCSEEVSESVALFSEGTCLNCYDCPYCFNHLTLRRKGKSLIEATKNKNFIDGASYYLICTFCLWSQKIEAPDQKNLTLLSAAANHGLSSFMDLYESKVCWNQTESSYRNFFVSNTVKLEFTLNQNTPNLRTNTLALLVNNLPMNIQNFGPSVTEEKHDELPLDIFSSTVNLSKVTTLQQRLANPSLQPKDLDQLKPLRRQLTTEKLRLCPECSHNLRVPNPKAANNFKVNRNCFYFIPKLKVERFEPLRYDSFSEIILEVTNCFPYHVSVHFFPNFDSTKSILKPALKKSLDIITLPKIPILLSPKFNGNTSDGVRVRFLIQPNILASINDDAIFSFVMQYSYLNKNLKIPEMTKLKCKIFVNIGKLDVL